MPGAHPAALLDHHDARVECGRELAGRNAADQDLVDHDDIFGSELIRQDFKKIRQLHT